MDPIQTPAPQAATETPAAPAAEAPVSSSITPDDIAGLLASDDAQVELTPEAPPVEPPAPEAPPVTPPATPEAPPAAPPVAAQPAAPQAPQAPQEPTPPTQAAPTEPPAAAPQDLATMRKQNVELLAKTYAITPDDAAKILSEPETALPPLLANLHMTVLEQTVQAVMGQLPRMVKDIGERERAASEAENAFFSKWPKLKDHKADVESVLRLYRQANPGASVERTIAEVGAMVMVSKGIALDMEPAAPLPNVPPQAFRPARPSPAPMHQPQPGQGNVFGELAEQIMREDLT